jgi:hypothetical protein
MIFSPTKAIPVRTNKHQVLNCLTCSRMRAKLYPFLSNTLGTDGLFACCDKVNAGGYTFDDIHLYKVIDDIQMLSIDHAYCKQLWFERYNTNKSLGSK